MRGRQLHSHLRRLLTGCAFALAGAYLGWNIGGPVRAKPPASDRVSAVRVAVASPLVVPPTVESRAGPADDVRVQTPVYKPRDPAEWQGMLVDTSMQSTCGPSHACGLAMACHGERCGPCAADAECAGGESCVLDHCVPSSQVGCRTRRDCAGEELCVLSGYSSDPRGNEEMRAECLAPAGGRVETVQARPWTPIHTGEPAVRPEALLRSLDEER